MNCPHLTVYKELCCVSDNECLLPTKTQVEEFCMKAEGFANCGFFRSFLNTVELFSYSVD